MASKTYSLLSRDELDKFSSFYEAASSFFADIMPGTKYIIDCCAGNAFLGLYALSQNQNINVLAIDRRVTNKAKEVTADFMQDFPGLEKRYEFQKSDITKGIIFPEKSLLFAVHACGSLTDILIEQCSSRKMPFAIMPCCYDRSRIFWQEPKIEFNGDLGEYIDELRINQIKKNYSNTQLLRINISATPMNRIIIAK